MSGTECVLCRQSTDDEVQLGKKYTCEGITAHYYCLLLTSNLMQGGDDDEGINGFLPNDIKSEVNRTSKLFCAYCKEKTATIGCCVRACRKSFHLPCALKNECRLEFTDTFKSFCDVHNGIQQPKKVHKATDSCTICYDDMGAWDPIESIQSPCCNRDSWYHKLCLMKYAQTSGYFLKCPLCNDSDQFRDSISKQGVFIPDRDAEWEETGPNAFYDFQQHSERPHECSAKTCKCSRGRKYESSNENHKNAFIYCHYCGGHSVHRGCTIGEIFLCEECSTVRHDTTEEEIIATTMIGSTQSVQPISNRRRSTNNHNRNGRQSRQENCVAIIDLGDSDEDYVATYSETTVESETVSVTRTTVSYPLRHCTVRIPRIGITQLSNSLTKKSSDDVLEFNVSDDSVLAGDSSMEHASQDNGDSDDEVIVMRKNHACLVSSDSDEETKSVDERQQSASPVRISDSDNSDGFDINDNSKKVFSSNVLQCREIHRRSESSGIESSSSLHTSSESLSSYYIQKVNQPTKYRFDKVYGISESPGSSIASTSSIKISSSSFRSSSNESTTSCGNESCQPIETSDSERSGSELETLINEPDPYPLQNEQKIIKTELNESSECGSSSSPINERKRRTIKHFFCGTSSSDDDVCEVKAPQRKVAKRSPRSMPIRPSNQRSISDMFIKMDRSF